MPETTAAPLAGVRIIEISSFVAVPLAGMTLAQLGAEVIRVDPVGGAADYHRWPITDDGTFEPNETLNITLSGPTGGATLGSPAAAVLTIVENDSPPPVGSLQLGSATGRAPCLNRRMKKSFQDRKP